jgi:hypothetical protein
MDPIIGGTLLNTGASLVDNIFNIGQAKKQRQHQKELAEYSYQKDTEMWNKANEYNLPANQMKRLADANLNPNLVYGNGSVAGNSTPAQTPKFQAYTPEYAQIKTPAPDLMQMLSQYQDLKIKKVQTDNLTEELNGKKLNNFYLSQFLNLRNQNSDLDLTRKRVEYGQDVLYEPDGIVDAFKRSPVFTDYQQTLKKGKQENMMREFDLNLQKKGLSRNDNMILRMLVQNGLFDDLMGGAKNLFNNTGITSMWNYLMHK